MKFNSLIPELAVTNIEKSKEFYSKVLGFKLKYERKQDKFAFMAYYNSQIMLEEINHNWDVGKLTKPFGRGINFQIQTNDIELISQRLKDSNVKIYKDIFMSKYKVEKTNYIEKELLVQDPDGYLLRFQQTIEKTIKV